MVSVLTIPTVLVLYVVVTMWLSWVSFRHYQMTRPPLGVFNLGVVTAVDAPVQMVRVPTHFSGDECAADRTKPLLSASLLA